MSEREDFETWERACNPVYGVGAKMAAWAAWQARAASDKHAAELQKELAEAAKLVRELTRGYDSRAHNWNRVKAFLARHSDKQEMKS